MTLENTRPHQERHILHSNASPKLSFTYNAGIPPKAFNVSIVQRIRARHATPPAANKSTTQYKRTFTGDTSNCGQNPLIYLQGPSSP